MPGSHQVVPRISAVVPLYNKEDRVQKCLTSIAAQRSSVFEVIIINDGSTDDSCKVATEALNRLSLCGYVVTQKNKGVSAARNAGVRRAKGDYIAFLDADDEWLPEFIAKMNSLIVDCPDAALYGCAHSVHWDNEVRIIRPGVRHGFRGYLSNFFYASLFGSVANSSKAVVQKKALNQIGGFPTGAAVSEDIYVWMRLASRYIVAFEDFVGARVTILDDQSRHLRQGIPYPVEYYSRIGTESLPFAGRLFLRRVILTRCLYAYSSGDVSTVTQCSLAAREIFPFMSRGLALLMFIPPSFASSLLSLGRLYQRALRKGAVRRQSKPTVN